MKIKKFIMAVNCKAFGHITFFVAPCSLDFWRKTCAAQKNVSNLRDVQNPKVRSDRKSSCNLVLHARISMNSS